ncbi:MAG TPA: hypothetical protein VIY48_21990 [Candidatus Paceibacterota bacterium]
MTDHAGEWGAPTLCADCSTPLAEGEAKCFTVCESCWDKHYSELSRTLRATEHMDAARKGIPADGNLHRCYCGVPVFFDAGPEMPSAQAGGNYTYNYTGLLPCWRETSGNPHCCTEVPNVR